MRPTTAYIGKAKKPINNWMKKVKPASAKEATRLSPKTYDLPTKKMPERKALEVDLIDESPRKLELNDLAEPLRGHVETVIQSEVEKALAPHLARFKEF